MFLKRSLPRLPPSSRSILASRSDSSGIIGGGGPAGFLTSWINVLDLLLEPLLLGGGDVSPPRSLLNHPLLLFDFLSSMKLPLLRLAGLVVLTSMLGAACESASPLAYAELSIFLLNSRRMLPCRCECVGEAGMSSAGRFTPPLVPVESGDVASGCSPFEEVVGLVFSFSSCLVGVLGKAGSSWIGEGRGAGMLVPSVSDEKLKSRAGSSKVLAGAGAVATLPFVRAGMVLG